MRERLNVTFFGTRGSILRCTRVLDDVDVYIGDGASLSRPIVRRRDGLPFGHTTVRAQIDWCRRYRIPRAFITHCGKQLVQMPARELEARVRGLGGGDVRCSVAWDGRRVRLGAAA